MGCTSTKIFRGYDIGEETVNNIKVVLCHGGIEDIDLSAVINLINHSVNIVLQNYRLTKHSLRDNEKIHLSLYLAIKFLPLLFATQWNYDSRFKLGFYEMYDGGIDYSLPEHKILTILGDDDVVYTRRLMYEKGLDNDEFQTYVTNKIEMFLWKRQISLWLYNVFTY